MKTALIIIFNSDFTENIPKLEKLYKDRFSHIFYLAPDFYAKIKPAYAQDSKIPMTLVNATDKLISKVRRTLNKRNTNELPDALYPVYGNQLLRTVGYQFHFYHFVAQAWPRIKQCDADWYWVIGDDVLLNKGLDENSLYEQLGLTDDNDCIVCDPEFHIIYENWINNFAGSEQSALSRVKSIIGEDGYDRVMAHYMNSKRGDIPANVIGSFSDFFGFRNTFAPQVMRGFEQANKLRLFVEIAVPNILLGLSKNPKMTQEFIFWDYPNKRYDWQETTDMLLADKSKLFAHPVKFSRIDEQSAADFR